MGRPRFSGNIPSAAPGAREDLPRVHDVMGVEGPLEALLQGNGRLGKLHPEVWGLGEADAVLPREGAAQFPHQGKDILHGGPDRLPFPVDLAVIEEVDVEVAVPGVAVTGDEQASPP